MIEEKERKEIKSRRWEGIGGIKWGGGRGGRVKPQTNPIESSTLNIPSEIQLLPTNLEVYQKSTGILATVSTENYFCRKDIMQQVKYVKMHSTYCRSPL